MSCGETARFSEPYDSLMNLEVPPGWMYRSARSVSIAENWNSLVDFFLEDKEAQWMLLVNDDHIYPPSALLRMLSHDRDVVTGLYLTRQAPFLPVLADHVDGNGLCHPRYLHDGERGLAEVKACGDGCLLLRRSVLEAIPAPRWELGVQKPDACDHDTAFSVKVRNAGFTIWADLEVWIGHLAVIPVYPCRDAQGKWATALVTGPRQILTIERAQSSISIT